MKRISLMAIALTLGVQLLVGCGSTTPTATLSKSNLQVSGVSAKSYTSNSKIYRICTDALDDYTRLLRDWDYTSSNSEKDRIEMKMLSVLTQALKDSKYAASYDYSSERITRLANNALDRYETLYRQWQYAYSSREKREIVNDMLTTLTRAVKDIKSETNR